MASGHHIRRRSESLAPAWLDVLRAGGVATAHESFERQGLLDPGIRPIQQGVSIAGTAVTVLTEPDDNLMIHAAVERCGPHDVLVVATTGVPRHGLVGELLATALQARRVAGIVLDAGIRDTAELRAMSFPAWARLVSALGATKVRPGSVNVPVTCGGQVVEPGDAIVADDDGVACIARDAVPDVVGRIRARVDSEDEKRALFASGTLSLDLYGLRDTLRDLGVESDPLEDEA